MIKRRRVYICDHCGSVAIEEEHFSINNRWKSATRDWTITGKQDLCPTCSKIYERFVKENRND